MPDTDKVKKIKAQISRLTLEEIISIEKYVDGRKKKEWANRQIERDLEHANRIKALPIGTKVIIKYGARANETGTIYRIGRKYVGVELGNGDTWKFTFNYVDDRINDRMVKLTASSNKGLQSIFNSESD